MEQYQKPSLEVVVFDEDTITTSGCIGAAPGVIQLPELP